MSLAGSALVQGEAIQKRVSQLYAADAGAEVAIWWIGYADHSSDPLPSAVGSYQALPLVTETAPSLRHKSYVTYLGAQNGGDKYEIRAYAGPSIVDDSSRDSPQPRPYQLVVTDVVNYPDGIFGNAITTLAGNLSMGNNSGITSTPQSSEGNILANGNLIVGNNVDIQGDVAVTDAHTISLGHNSQIGGTSTSGATISLPTVDTSTYLTQAQVAQNGVLLSASAYSNTNNATYTINNANTHLTGNLVLGNNTILTVDGNLYVDGYISTGNNCTLTIGGALYVGGYLSTGNNNNLTFGGTTYVNGTLNLSNNGALSGAYTVVANGSITFNNNSVTSPANTPVFISQQGNIVVDNNVSINAFLYAPNGSISVGNNAQVTGSLVGESVSLSNNSLVTYVTSGRNGLPGQRISVITWQVLQ